MIKKYMVINVPGKKYQNVTEKQTGEENFNMNIIDFDKFIDFKDEYKHHMNIPDKELIIGEKEGRTLNATIFYKQPLTRLGNINEQFRTTNILINPESKYKSENGFLMPDIDIIIIEGIYAQGVRKEKESAFATSEFYKKYGWNSIVTKKEFETQTIKPTSERVGKIIIPNLEDVLDYANRAVGYRKRKLYFMKD